MPEDIEPECRREMTTIQDEISQTCQRHAAADADDQIVPMFGVGSPFNVDFERDIAIAIVVERLVAPSATTCTSGGAKDDEHVSLRVIHDHQSMNFCDRSCLGLAITEPLGEKGVE